jgi:hypothetical protein
MDFILSPLVFHDEWADTRHHFAQPLNRTISRILAIRRVRDRSMYSQAAPSRSLRPIYPLDPG